MLLEGFNANEALTASLRAAKAGAGEKTQRKTAAGAGEGAGSTGESGAPAAPAAPDADSSAPKDRDIVRLEALLGEQLGSPVEIAHQASGGGVLMVRYHDLEILEGIIERLVPSERW